MNPSLVRKAVIISDSLSTHTLGYLLYQSLMRCKLRDIRDMAMPTLIPVVLQTARHLIKQILAAQKGQKIAGTSAYLAEIDTQRNQKSAVSTSEDWLSPRVLETALR